MCPPHLFVKRCIAGAAGCLWQAQIRACGALCLSVIEAWVHNSLEARGHDIHLPAISSSNTVRVIASATQPQHAARAHFTKLTCPSFLSATVAMCLGNDFQVQTSILTESAASNAYKCLLVRTAQAIECQGLF